MSSRTVPNTFDSIIQPKKDKHMKTLKNVLLVNALSSGATGLGLIAFAAPIAILFGISEPTPVMEVGIFLVVFAILVFRGGQKNNL